jgi:aspartyl-tRNA(Asn)/glutamyl-tRNA(Gln) amidotransferase subunit A
MGPLGGIPIAVKDNFCTKDVKTTAGSKMLDSYLPPFDSTVTKRLEAAGAIVIGKTNMDEFGMGSANIFSAYGPTTSPWSAVAGENVSAGGSSGGSAAALASSTCFACV